MAMTSGLPLQPLSSNSLQSSNGIDRVPVEVDGPPVWIAGKLVPPHGEEVKAKPSPSPLVTPALGDRLCRLASQHVMSDYSRLKRGVFTPVTPAVSDEPPVPSRAASLKQPIRGISAASRPLPRQISSGAPTPPVLPTPSASPTPSLTSQLANLVAANSGSPRPDGLTAPAMSGRSKSAPHRLSASHGASSKGVASTFGGYVAALAGSISSTFTSQGFPSFVGSTPPSPGLGATFNGINGHGTPRMQGPKRKPRTQTPGDSPAQPSVVLPPVNGTALDHFHEPRRNLMDEEGHQGVLPPVSNGAIRNGIEETAEDTPMSEAPASVPMAMADSRDSVFGSSAAMIEGAESPRFAQKNGFGSSASQAHGTEASTPANSGMNGPANGTGSPVGYSRDGCPILKGTRAPPSLSRSSSLRSPASGVVPGSPRFSDPVPALPQTPVTPSIVVGDSPPVIKTSESHPMNISPVLPPELLTAFGHLLLSDHTGGLSSRGISLHCARVDMHDLTGPNSATARSLLPGACFPITPVKTADHRTSVKDDVPRLGNMLLSSCPGKKIRLSNNSTPEQRLANGNRSAICRDLGLDFRRAAEMGVKAVVCCIDDAELAFLGSPWSAYYNAATEAGLAVLRIPMAEGFAPASGVEEMDALLATVVQNWTIKGQDVLCHCRGGVGRAGLVACCWLIRCGLVRTSLDQGAIPGAKSALDQQPPVVDGEYRIPDARYLRHVERVIEVIRRRRSVKSIETPLQAAFVLQYLEYTQSGSASPASTSSFVF